MKIALHTILGMESIEIFKLLQTARLKLRSLTLRLWTGTLLLQLLFRGSPLMRWWSYLTIVATKCIMYRVISVVH